MSGEGWPSGVGRNWVSPGLWEYTNFPADGCVARKDAEGGFTYPPSFAVYGGGASAILIQSQVGDFDLATAILFLP
jgi:hypothetical protein